MKKIYITAAVTALIVATLLLIPSRVSSVPDQSTSDRVLTHAQDVWMNALEWCESHGNNEAINPKDNDGTPSYGAFQFKPTTLDYFAEKYGVATTTLMDYATQKAVVTEMILHRDEIRWDRQFPGCVKKLGSPPRPTNENDSATVR